METPKNPTAKLPRRREANPLAASLKSTIKGMESAGRIQENMAVVYWSRAVGSQAAAATEAESVRDGILFVNTKSSVWSHELTLYKARILTELNRLLDGQNIRDIVFRVKRLKVEPSVETRDTPTLEELKAVQLEASERAVLRGRLEDLIEIQDDNIRTKIATRLTLDAKLRHWRVANGWKVCHGCGTVHKTEYELCPICRLCR